MRNIYSFIVLMLLMTANTTVVSADLLVLESLDATLFTSDPATSGHIPPVIIGDGIVSRLWEKAPGVLATPLISAGVMKSVNDKSNIYIYMSFRAELEWIVINWAGNQTQNATAGIDPFADGDDIWAFSTNPEFNKGDSSFWTGSSTFPVLPDERNDVFWEFITEETNNKPVHHLEIQRALSTNDTEGADVDLSNEGKFFTLSAKTLDGVINNQTYQFEFRNRQLDPAQFQVRNKVKNVPLFLFNMFSYAVLAGGILYSVVMVATSYLYKEEEK